LVRMNCLDCVIGKKCKECRRKYDREYYASNKGKLLEKKKQNTNRTWERNIQNLAQYLLEHPCVDCGETDTRLLECDHLHSKTHNVTEMIRGYSWTRILEEIDKCEVRCCNCHRLKTIERSGSWRNFIIQVNYEISK
jgi:hypothetical protein